MAWGRYREADLQFTDAGNRWVRRSIGFLHELPQTATRLQFEDFGLLPVITVRRAAVDVFDPARLTRLAT
jgi:hypothetical protein